MKKRNILFTIITTLTIISALFFTSCERDPNVLEPADYPVDPEVFIDGFSSGLNYAAFGGSKVTAFDVVTDVKYKGTRSMRIEVPDFEDPLGAYAGGAYYTNVGRNLTGFDALTFWAKASQSANIDIVGIGNDLGQSKNLATISGLDVNTNWKKYIIPIPDPGRWTAERGMFFYSEGPENNKGYTIWFDEVKFEKLGTIAYPRPSILEGQDQNTVAIPGQTLNIGGTFVIFNMPDGTDQRVDVSPSYFTYSSSNESVATVNENGQISIVGLGTAKVTAKFGSTNAAGSITITIEESPERAPVPTVPADKVISLFSNAYTNVPVDTWATGWLYSTAVLNEIQIEGDDVKLYTNLNFNGIEFASQTIDATQMTHFHLDIWTPNSTDSSEAFKVMLVDFGANGVYGGGDDVSSEVTFTANTNPPLATKQWVQLDIPMSAFSGLTTKAHLAQLVISGDLSTVYVDNVYFYKEEGGVIEPTEPAPTPTLPAADVISLFSNAYTNVPVDTWATGWLYSTAVLHEIQIEGDDVKLYTELNFNGIEFASQTIDATSMTHFHMDIWTPNSTASPAVFKVMLVDFGANGVFGGGDDVSSEITFTANTTPPLATQEWVQLDVPLSAFTGLTTRQQLAQLVISGDLPTLYVDNVFFYNQEGGGTEPTTPAPTPTFPAADVISLFSNPYTNVPVDTWSASWDQADVADIQIAGNDTKLYTNLVYAGIEFISQTVDATSMTHFRMDIWTPDPTALPAVFKIKLVDFGANGTFGGGDDVEHELTFDANSTPPLVTSEWVSFDIPLSNFTGLITKGHLAQLIISGDPNTVYVDNILFHK